MASSSSSRRIKGGWSKEEDDILRKLVAAHGTTSWSIISRSIPGRCGKSCRLRWCNQISPDVAHRPFTADEDQVVIAAYRKLGNRWAAIARLLPGRTENSVKNRWHCNLKRKFTNENHGDDAKVIIHPPFKKINLMTPSGDSGSNKEMTSSAVPTQSSDIDDDDDPGTILSLAPPGTMLKSRRVRIPVVPQRTSSPVEDKMSVMENKSSGVQPVDECNEEATSFI